MTSPDQRPSSQARADAIAAVANAAAAGRIVEADRDRRIAELQDVQTQRELDMVVHDLRPEMTAGEEVGAATYQTYPAAGPDPVSTVEPGEPVTAPRYGPTHTSTPVAASARTSGSGWTTAVVLAVVGAVVAGFAGAIIAFAQSTSDTLSTTFAPSDETTYLPGQAPSEDGVNVHTADGYADLVAAVREGTGSTEVFSLVLYPRYAVMYVPTETTGKRYQNHYYDGELQAQDSRGTTDDPRFDLSTLDPAVMVSLLEQARAKVDEPTSWYLIMDAPAEDGGALSAYASNEFSESVYLRATMDGTILLDSSQTS